MNGFQDIILSSGARTPLGDFGKSLRDIPLTTLAVHAVLSGAYSYSDHP